MDKFDFAFNVPLNNISFGQTSVAILREIHKLGHEPSIFPIGGQIDISAQEEKEGSDFHKWLINGVRKSIDHHSRKNNIFKLWHLSNSLESFSEKQILYTFYELDTPTQAEINAVRNQNKVLVSNKYTKSVFDNFGLDNVEVLPLGFDKHNFKVTNKKYYYDDRIVFLLLGKFEKRKHHAKAIEAWLKKYGNNPRYFLTCAIYNPFLKPEDNQAIFNNLLQGKKYFNVQFLGHLMQNSLYNDLLNSGHIVLSVSGGEGYDLPSFQCLALGKHAVVLNAHAYKEYANEQNAVLINPCGKIECYDGMFFHKDQPFNQGNIFTWAEEEFLNGCDLAIQRVQKSPINTEGLKLQEEFTYEKVAKRIIEVLR